MATSMVRLTTRTVEGRLDADTKVLYDATIIKAGEGNDDWPDDVLANACRVMEGMPCYSGHMPGETVREVAMRKSDPKNLEGRWKNVRWDAAARAVKGDLHYFDTALPTIQKAQEAHTAGDSNLLGVSVDFLNTKKKLAKTPKGLRWQVTEIHPHDYNSADLVVFPAAGGRLFESKVEGSEVDPEEVMRALESMTAEERAAFIAARPELFKAADPPPAQQKDPPANPADRAVETKLAQLEEATKKAEEAQRRATEAAQAAEHQKQLIECQNVLSQRATESEVGKAWSAILLKEYAGKVFDVKDFETRIESIKEARSAEGKVNLPNGSGIASVGAEERDKLQVALDGFFNPNNQDLRADWWDARSRGTEAKGDLVPRFRTLREAYHTITGTYPHQFNWQKFARESLAGGYDSGLRATEALTSSTWGETLGDSITRRAIAEYNSPSWQQWRPMASDIVPVNDFRTQRRFQIGGFGTLDSVSEGGDYQEAANPADLEATYALGKYGNTVSITMEMMANDDVGAIRRIPIKLGRAAALTLASYIWVTVFMGCESYALTRTAVTDGGSTGTDYLSSSSRGNNGSTTLTLATLDAAMIAMRDQAAYGDSSDVLGVRPKWLVVPNELERVARELTGQDLYYQTTLATGNTPAAYSNAPPNYLYSGIQVVSVDLITDADAWFLVADPASCPTFEVGFYQGREEPEIFVQDSPNVGSMFDSDKILYKVRHIWGFCWLDSRSFYGAVP